MDLTTLIRDVPDFPKPGVVFKDITPLLAHPRGLAEAVDRMAEPFRDHGVAAVCGAESRGFIFAAAIALALDCGFVPIRKPDKLPARTHGITYDLEYGSDTLEVHADAIQPGDRVLMVDDLLATGGTMNACCQLIDKIGGHIVGLSVLIELGFLHGRDKLADYQPLHAVMTF